MDRERERERVVTSCAVGEQQDLILFCSKGGDIKPGFSNSHTAHLFDHRNVPPSRVKQLTIFAIDKAIPGLGYCASENSKCI